MHQSERPLVSVAILTWNRAGYLVKAIDSIISQSYSPFEIVVVDSNSEDGTCDIVAKMFPAARLIRLHRNMGCPEGRNVALANCKGELIFSLDDDAWLAEDTIEQCVALFTENEQLGVVACKIVAPGEMYNPSGMNKQAAKFSGGAAMLRRDALLKAGYFPHDFFRQAEEGDLTLRIMDSGYAVWQCPSAIVFHEKAPINRNPKLFIFYTCRNELATVMRRYPWYWVPPALAQKVVSWVATGTASGVARYVFLAFAAFLARLPSSIRQRRPVSGATMKTFFGLKARRSSNIIYSSVKTLINPLGD